MNTQTTITRKEYMKNSSELHHAYYSQFITESTKRFVLTGITIEQIKNAISNGDKHLNSIEIPYNDMSRGGGWWWDCAPVNMALIKEMGESKSPSTFTCVAKAAARIMAESTNL